MDLCVFQDSQGYIVRPYFRKGGVQVPGLGVMSDTGLDASICELKKENLYFEASLGYTVRPRLKTNKHQQQEAQEIHMNRRL